MTRETVASWPNDVGPQSDNASPFSVLQRACDYIQTSTLR